MAQLTNNRVLNALLAFFSSLDSTDQATVKKAMWRKKWVIDCHDSATAGTAFTASPLYYNDTGADVKVVSARCTAPVAVTGHASNYATFSVAKLDTAGANSATVATYATDAATTKDMVANVAKDMTLTAANVIVPAGYYLVGAIAKASSGVAVTAATSRARIEVEIEPV
jgi:hypothetical protein